MVSHAWQHMADILVPNQTASGRPQLYFTDFPDWHFADGWATGRLMQVGKSPTHPPTHPPTHLPPQSLSSFTLIHSPTHPPTH